MTRRSPFAGPSVSDIYKVTKKQAACQWFLLLATLVGFIALVVVLGE